MVLSHNWIPIHDAFQITNIVYFIFNEVTKHHAVPLWYPYINYGVDANWYLTIAIGPSLATLLPLARLFGTGDALYFYYLSLLFDEIILLVGTYLLARTLFRSRLSVLFVCIAMTGSTLWYAQPWFNFHLYYFIPLSAYFVVTGAIRSEIWRFLAGGLALLISEFGNLPYFFVPHVLSYIPLAAGALWAYRFDTRKALGHAGVRELATLLGCGLTAVIYFVFLSYGVHHINYNFGRTRTLVGVEDFLTYGGAVGFQKFAELFTGTSWSIDINGYAGVLVFASMVFGFIRAPDRRMVPYLITAVFLTLTSIGEDTFVAPSLYQLPGVAYYRHVGLLLPLIKVMIIVLAGFGFDALMMGGGDVDATATKRTRHSYVVVATILGVMLLVAFALTGQVVSDVRRLGHQTVFPVVTHGSGFEYNLGKFVNRVVVVTVVYVTAICALLAASRWPRLSVTVVGITLLGIQTADVYGYRMFQFQDHMVPIDMNYRKLFAFEQRPLASKRTLDPMADPRFRAVASHFSHPIPRTWYTDCLASTGAHCYWNFADTPEGVYYNTLEPLVGLDPCRSVLRTDYWLPGVDVLYRSSTGLPLHDLDILPSGYENRTIYFPILDRTLQKMIACETPKFQVFSALTIQSEGTITQLLREPKYRGDLLLASDRDYAVYAAASGNQNMRLPTAKPDWGASTRVDDDIRVLAATANSVTVRSFLPAGDRTYWLYFSDAWHPFWQAHVNGIRVPILRAYFGFKAVEIPGGVATITFEYRSRVLTAAEIVAGTLLICAMLTILTAATRLLMGP
ncbi:MAG TPA: hypothetical protein VJT33_11810 [bacterium]|nr:hypothetical protein [bacterium]